MSRHSHYMIHKPYGYLSQFVNNQNRRRNKKLLGKLGNFSADTMSIGRLDEKSEGLLLLTTNGRISELVRSKKVEKEYHIQVDGLITEQAVQQLQEGVIIPQKRSTYHTQPCKAFILEEEPSFEQPLRQIRGSQHGPTSWLSITITEGKYRQVRKMSAAVGFPTLRLVRVRIGDIHLGRLKAGEWKEISDEELMERI